PDRRHSGGPRGRISHRDWRAIQLPGAFPGQRRRVSGSDVHADQPTATGAALLMGEFRELGAPPKNDAADAPRRNIVQVDADVLADLGHQLRNQLNAVVGAAGLLATGAETSEERELAAIVEAGAEQVARIIDEWLDSATIESGEFELALHPFDVRS